MVTLSNPRIARPGTVGPAVEGVELAIDSRPDTLGQLLVRTPSRALAVIDREAAVRDERAERPTYQERRPRAGGSHTEWIETGDLAVVDADGHVRITGRLLDTLVLSVGTKVPPAEVEAALAEDPVVAQVCVVGDGLVAPVALVVPEPTVLRAAIRRMGLRIWSRRSALRHPQVLQWRRPRMNPARARPCKAASARPRPAPVEPVRS